MFDVSDYETHTIYIDENICKRNEYLDIENTFQEHRYEIKSIKVVSLNSTNDIRNIPEFKKTIHDFNEN